jgi:tetratricopeptide (TPR) repeat protein
MSIAESTDRQAAEPRKAPSSPTRREWTLNFPFLVGSSGLFVILAISAYAMHYWQVTRTAAVFLRRADQLESEQKWFEAASYIQQYLRLNPESSSEWIRMARLYEQGATTFSQRERAIELYYRALGTGPDDEASALQQRVASLLLHNQRFLEAQTAAEELLASNPGDAKGLRLRALALWGQWQGGGLISAGSSGTSASASEATGRQGAPVDMLTDPSQGPSVAKSGTNIVIIALEDALAKNGSDIELTVALATAYRDRVLKAYLPVDRTKSINNVSELSETDRIKLADSLMGRFSSLRSTNPQELLASYQYSERWNLAGSQADLDAAVRLAPKNVPVLLAAAQNAYRQAQRIKAAGGAKEEVQRLLDLAGNRYQQVIQLDPASQNPQPHLHLGAILTARGLFKEATAAWNAGLAKFKASPYAVEFHARLADHQIEQGLLKDAETTLIAVDTAIAKFPPGVAREAVLNIELDQDLRRGLWHIKRKEPREAIPFLQRVALRQEQLGGRSEQSLRALLLLGGAFASQSNWNSAAEAYDRAALQEPGLAIAHLAASGCWLEANAVESAVERAERAVRLAPSCQTWYAVATAMYRQQLLLAGADRVWSRLDQALAAGIQLVEDKTLAEPWRLHLLQADSILARANGPISDAQRQEALAILQQAEAKYPEDRGLARSLPNAYQRLGASVEADRSCERLASVSDAAEEALLIRARLLQMRGEYDTAAEMLTQLSQDTAELAPLSLQQEMINIKLARRDYSAARNLLLAVHAQSPKDLTTLRRLADIDLEGKKLVDVERWETAMTACGSAGELLALYFKTRRSLLQVATPTDPLLATAAEDQARLVKAEPNWAEAVALGGMIEQARGRLDQAIQAYERAVRLGDQRMATYERLISLLEANNRTSDAERYLARLKSRVPLSQRLTVFESTLELRRNQLDEAIEIARNGVHRRPEDATAHIWLGRMLDRKDLLKDAEAAFLEATRVAPQDARSWSALIEFHVRVGNLPKARQGLKDLATTAKVAESDRSFLMAQHYELLGDRELAGSEYAKAVADAPQNPVVLLRAANFYRRIDLEKSLEFAKSAYQIDPESALARRTLAAILADRGREEDWQALDQLFGQTQAAEVSEDNRFRAVLQARRGGAANLAEAIAIMVELVDRASSRSVADRLMLARLYERQAGFAKDSLAAEQSIAKAREQFALLCEGTFAEAPHLIAYANFLLRRGEIDAARKPMAQLAVLIKSSAKVAPTLRAEYIRLSLAQGDVAVAEEQLLELEQAEPDALFCISLRAQLLEKAGKSQEIEPLVEAAAERLIDKAQRAAEQAAVCQGTGDLYASLQRPVAAEKWYRKLYSLVPARFGPLVGMLAEQGRVADAIEVCREAATETDSIGPGLAAVAVLSRGNANAEETASAQALIAEIRRQHPQDVQLLSAIATLQVVQGRTAEAVTAYSDLVKQNDRDLVALNNLATLLGEHDNRRDEALGFINKAIEIAGSQPNLLDTRGTILYLQGRPEEAIKSLEPAVRQADPDPRFRFHLALAYQDVHRTQDAKVELEQALKSDLDKQILTPNEQKLLAQLRTLLSL